MDSIHALLVEIMHKKYKYEGYTMGAAAKGDTGVTGQMFKFGALSCEVRPVELSLAAQSSTCRERNKGTDDPIRHGLTVLWHQRCRSIGGYVITH